SPGWPFHSRAVPLFNRLQRPVRSTISVTAVTSVRDAMLFSQERVGDGEAVITPRMTLHVDGLRHMAIDAAVARLIEFMKSVGCPVNFRRQRDRAIMTAQA